MSNGFLNAKDLEVAKILDGFIPDRVFDAHMHISDVPFGGDERFGFSEYYRDNAPYFGKREVRCMALTAPTALQKSEDGYIKSVKYMSSELDAYPKNLGSLLVKPTQSARTSRSGIPPKTMWLTAPVSAVKVMMNTLVPTAVFSS